MRLIVFSHRSITRKLVAFIVTLLIVIFALAAVVVSPTSAQQPIRQQLDFSTVEDSPRGNPTQTLGANISGVLSTLEVKYQGGCLPNSVHYYSMIIWEFQDNSYSFSLVSRFFRGTTKLSSQCGVQTDVWTASDFGEPVTFDPTKFYAFTLYQLDARPLGSASDAYPDGCYDTQAESQPLTCQQTTNLRDLYFVLTAQASTFIIADGDVAGLIAAINTSNTDSVDDTIELAANGTYTLTAVNNDTDGPNGLPTILSDNSHKLTINGNGAKIERSAASTDNFRIFHISSGGDLTLNDLIISKGLVDVSGGGIQSIGGTLTLQNCTVSDNSAGNRGGGLYLDNTSGMLTNNTISDNSAGSAGGGLFVYGSLTLINNTITRNSTGFLGSGMVNFLGSPTVITNCIIWGNTGDVDLHDFYGGSSVSYSDIGSGYTAGPGNISADPVFIAPTNGDFHLQSTSPCINAGTNSAASLPATDKDGNPRIIGGTVDMGAFEFQGTANSPPTISGATISRQQGAPASNSTIATVSDAQDPAGSLTVTATSVPAGISVTNIINTNGTVTTDVAAGTTAMLGDNTVELTVTDSGSLTATANLIVNVTPSPTPTCNTTIPFAWPTDGNASHLSQDYAQFNLRRKDHHHTGIDIGDRTERNALATATGKVKAVCPNGVEGGCFFDDDQQFSTNAGNNGLQGVVILEHSLPDGSIVYSLYGHLKSVESFNPNQCVEAGRILGRTGGLPGTVDRPDNHLHFEIKDKPVLHNPLTPKNSCRDPGTLKLSEKCWGYTFAHPNDHGYRDPLEFLHVLEKSNFPQGVQIIEKKVSLRVGPGGFGSSEYRVLNQVSSGQYDVLSKSGSTSNPSCLEGWYQIRNKDGTRFDDTSRPGSSIPDAWVCVKFTKAK